MLSLFLLALIPLVATSHGVRDNDHHRHPQTSCPSNNPFTLEPAFTITLQLGQFPPQIQPPNSNGTFGLQPVLSGTVAGPLLNGTIIRGLGHASRFTTYYLDDDESYGTTDDGFSFYFHQSGVGNGIGKVDRLVSIADRPSFALPFSSFAIVYGIQLLTRPNIM